MAVNKFKKSLTRLTRRYSPQSIQRGSVLRSVATAFDFIYFGTVHRDDDIEPIRGFTASTKHIDNHYIAGQRGDYPIRIIDRFDTVRVAGSEHDHEQSWCVIEIQLEPLHHPHICLVPTGPSSAEYQSLFRTYSHLQPLNASLLRNHSPEVNGRFQILARTARMHDVERLLTTPIILGIAAKFWPLGVEIHSDKLYVYVTDHHLTKTTVASAIDAGLWLAEQLDAA